MVLERFDWQNKEMENANKHMYRWDGNISIAYKCTSHFTNGTQGYNLSTSFISNIYTVEGKRQFIKPEVKTYRIKVYKYPSSFVANVKLNGTFNGEYTNKECQHFMAWIKCFIVVGFVVDVLSSKLLFGFPCV